MEAEIALKYDDVKTAKAVSEAISPDNLRTPRALSVRTVVEGNTVLTRIVCGKRCPTFLATIEDLLSSASIAEKTMHTIKKIH